MQRADAEERGAGLARQRAGAAERGEVADPLVAVRASAHRAAPRRRSAACSAALARWASDGATTSAHSTPSTISRWRPTGRSGRAISRSRIVRPSASAMRPASPGSARNDSAPPSSVKIVASIGPAGSAGSARSGTRRGASRRLTWVIGRRRALVSATSLARLSRTCACVAAGSRNASSSASLVCGRNDGPLDPRRPTSRRRCPPLRRGIRPRAPSGARMRGVGASTSASASVARAGDAHPVGERRRGVDDGIVAGVEDDAPRLVGARVGQAQPKRVAGCD